MIQQFNQFVVAVAPALRAAFIHAAKVAGFIILSAAISAVAAYVSGNAAIDPAVLVIVNVALAAFTKAIAVLNT